MPNYKVWVSIEVEDDNGEHSNYDLPDCVGCYDTLEEAQEAAANVGLEIETEADSAKFTCWNCGETYGSVDDFKPLDECVELTERLTPGAVVPNGECLACGAFIYEHRKAESE